MKQTEMDQMKKKQMEMKHQKKKSPASIIFLIIMIITASVLLYLYPQNRKPAADAAWKFFIELITVMPGVMVLMGLFTVWVSKDTIIKYLGHTSGVKGVLLALFLGMIPTGPLYVAFPLAAALLKKGARVANIMIFLSAWACIKLPQELVEMRFMGFYFMILRLVMTIILVVLMGFIIEKADKKTVKE